MNKQVDVIVEARMSSTRLPGKVLLPACGKPMLELMIERLRLIPELTNIIVATTTNPKDDCLVELAKRLKVGFFRGSEDDVLGRVVKAAQNFKTDIIVEITGDDPLLDPELSSKVIKTLLNNSADYDYVANDVEWTFPIGFNTRAFSRKVLEQVEAKTNHPTDREHVVNYIVKHPQEFRIFNIVAEGLYKRPEIRLTLDTEQDYLVMKAVFEALYPKDRAFSAKDIIDFLDANPKIKNTNQMVEQRTYEYN